MFDCGPVTAVDGHMKTLVKSSSAMRPSPRSHASNVVEGVRQCATRVGRGRPRWTAWVWMLLKSINARFLIQYLPPRSNAEEGYGQRSNAGYRWWRLNALRRRQWERCINLGLLTVTYGRAFWDRISYRIAIFCAVSYRIHRFPPRPYRAITCLPFPPRNLPIKFGTNSSTIFLVIVVTDRHTHRQTCAKTNTGKKILSRFGGENKVVVQVVYLFTFCFQMITYCEMTFGVDILLGGSPRPSLVLVRRWRL